MRKYEESKTTRNMMATVPHATSGSGLRKFQADGFLFDRVYIGEQGSTKLVWSGVGVRWWTYSCYRTWRFISEFNMQGQLCHQHDQMIDEQIYLVNCTKALSVHGLQQAHIIRYLQGRIKLFGAPRQWKHFRPLFQAVFLSGGSVTPQTESNTTSPSPKTEITNISFYILNFASIIKFKIFL